MLDEVLDREGGGHEFVGLLQGFAAYFGAGSSHKKAAALLERQAAGIRDGIKERPLHLELEVTSCI
jgi:hypothetical protein